MSKTHSSRVNGKILSSIPLNRKLKRYWESKYERICDNCGTEEAVRKMKNLRVQVLAYLADPNRKSNLGSYVSKAGFRNNGYLRMLFEYADTQPHYVLNFLKLYTGPVKPSKTVDQAATEAHYRLNAVKASEAVPKFLTAWLDLVFGPHKRPYELARKDPRHPFHRMAVSSSYEEFHQYFVKWFRILRAGWTSRLHLDEKPVFPEVYKDYDAERMESKSFTADFADLVSMHISFDSPLSQDELNFVDGFLDEDVADWLQSLLLGEECDIAIWQYCTFLSGTFVGHVQHIPKKGGGTDYRDIAVPNRFIQAALVPAGARLYNLVSRLPQDATFNQGRFDTKIQNRVNNLNLYQGSVDLSKATDNLPRTWGFAIVDRLNAEFHQLSIHQLEIISKALGMDASAEIEERTSLDLFKTVASAKWEDEGYLHEWKVGQPLGSLPSFAMLAITHNLFVEALSAHLGLKHSPYVILGDDIVIFNERVRTRYIRELTSRAIPLSLHKSYEGRLSEFAGKTFVKGSVPFYCSDHAPITWESLLDWQRSTGIRIPWDNLPIEIKRKIKSLSRLCLEKTGTEHPSLGSVTELAISSYHLAQVCEVPGKGSHLYPEWDSADWTTRIVGYYSEYYSRDESPIPDAVKHTGIALLSNQFPVTLMGERYADKDGYFHRFRPVQLPNWYKDKFRPCATSVAIECALMALLRSE